VFDTQRLRGSLRSRAGSRLCTNGATVLWYRYGTGTSTYIPVRYRYGTRRGSVLYVQYVVTRVLCEMKLTILYGTNRNE